MIQNHEKLITIYSLAPLICFSWDKASTQINIKSAFRCTGIQLLDNSIFDELDFESAFVTECPLSHSDELPSTSSTQLIELPKKSNTVSFLKARKNLIWKKL